MYLLAQHILWHPANQPTSSYRKTRAHWYVQALCEGSRDEINDRDGIGTTPLWHAATCGHADTVRVLVQAGVDPRKRDAGFGFMPLDDVAMQGYADVARVLLEAGVNPLSERKYDLGMQYGNAAMAIGQSPLRVS